MWAAGAAGPRRAAPRPRPRDVRRRHPSRPYPNRIGSVTSETASTVLAGDSAGRRVGGSETGAAWLCSSNAGSARVIVFSVYGRQPHTQYGPTALRPSALGRWLPPGVVDWRGPGPGLGGWGVRVAFDFHWIERVLDRYWICTHRNLLGILTWVQARGPAALFPSSTPNTAGFG